MAENVPIPAANLPHSCSHSPLSQAPHWGERVGHFVIVQPSLSQNLIRPVDLPHCNKLDQFEIGLVLSRRRLNIILRTAKSEGGAKRGRVAGTASKAIRLWHRFIVILSESGRNNSNKTKPLFQMETVHLLSHKIFEFISLQLIGLRRLTNNLRKFQICSLKFCDPFKSHLNLALALPVIHHGFVHYASSHWSLYKRQLS